MDLYKLLKAMSIDEKIGQLFQCLSSYFRGVAEGETGPLAELGLTERDLFRTGSVLSPHGAGEAIAVQRDFLEKSKHKIPLLFMKDVIHGYKTLYPVPLGLAASFDAALMKECAAVAAKEAAVDGIHVTFSPMADVSRDARWGRVVESGGEDPYLNRICARAAVEGYQGNFGKYNIAACVKHFVAYGAAEAGKDYNTVDMSYRTLYETYLPPFMEAVNAGAELVMAAFHTFDGVPVSANRRLINKVLREELGFEGVVISDWAAVKETIPHGVAEDEAQAAEKCFNAGVDIEMMSVCYLRHLKELIESGKIPEEKLDEAVMRVLKLKEKLGLFEDPYRSASEAECKKFFLCKEHREVARRAAEKSAVLLKNDGILPLSPAIKSVAVIGPLADSGEILGCWRCRGDIADTVTVAQGIRNLLGGSRVETAVGCGCSLYDTDESNISAAVELARRSEAVVLCLGEAQSESGEGTSRAFLDLPQVQYALFDAVSAVNPNVAVLLFTGRPLAIRRLNERARAILNMWFPGTEGGNAAADLLFGKAVPCGKLPVSFPLCEGQCPVYYAHLNTGRPRADEQLHEVLKSSYIDCHNYPLYPFGFGLSYTAFEYAGYRCSGTALRRGGKLTVSVDVKNTGKTAGEEVVQLYLRDNFASVSRPVRELKAFEKVSLAAGEKKTVCFEITEEMLGYYGADLKKRAEAGTFSVYLGGDSRCEKCLEFTLL